MSETPPHPKKRTRKATNPVKNVYVAQEAIDPPLDNCLEPDATNTVRTVPIKRIEKKKPNAVYNGFNVMMQPSEDENVIMKLNISNNNEGDALSSVAGDDELISIPDAYNLSACDAFLSKPVELNSDCKDETYIANDSHVDTQQSESTTSRLKVVQLLKDFEEKNKNNEWPSNTSIACYWCCHKFDNAPFGIPVKYVNSVFHVYGCFCSLECAAAHNLACKDSIDEMWERFNLINLLARKLNFSRGYVKPAPNRLALTMFGGHMTIEEFRTFTETSKIINVNFPPMMTMTQQIEEINESDINSEYKYIPLDTDRVNKYKEKIKLKRTKPLHDFKNTLDHAMNLKFGGGPQ